MQVGIEEGENIIFSVESVAAESVGAHTLVGNGQGALAASTSAAANPQRLQTILKYSDTSVLKKQPRQ